MNKTAVVILNWNGLSFLKMFLGTVLRFSSGEGVAIYVADNGSTDGSADYVAENFSGIRLIRLDRNNGFAGGYNMALSQIDAKYFVLLNSDIEVTGSWLEPLVSFMENNPDAGACQPKIRSWKDRGKFEYAGAAGGFIDWLGYPLCRGRILMEVEEDHGQYDDPCDIFWATGACMMVRSDAWKKCGGFDTDFYAHMEEIDLCWRLHRAGYRVSYVPGSTVYHIGGGTLPYRSPLKTYLNFRNSLFLLHKNLPDESLRRILFLRKLLDGTAALFFLLKGQLRSFLAVWKAHMDYYRSLKKTRIKRNVLKEQSGFSHTGKILNKSMVFEFYVKRKKTFSSLIKIPDK